jgi:hypothetical protein
MLLTQFFNFNFIIQILNYSNFKLLKFLIQVFSFQVYLPMKNGTFSDGGNNSPSVLSSTVVTNHMELLNIENTVSATEELNFKFVNFLVLFNFIYLHLNRNTGLSLDSTTL